jgi:hypothetical protein
MDASCPHESEACAEGSWDTPDVPPRSWVDLVGYQFEALHDGAITALLADERTGRRVASALFGAPVDAVVSVQRQARVGRATTDVRVLVDLGGEEHVVGVETKVDSQMTVGQLERTAVNGDRVVLLCLGASAMQTCTVAPVNDDDHDWPLLDVTRWADLLREVELPPLLDAYSEAVAEEASEHRRARAVARGEQTPGSFEPRNEDLLSWAWLDETWEAICSLEDPGRFRAHKDISGPIFFWEDSWTDFAAGAGGMYLDLMSTGGKHQIVLKASNVAAEKRSALHETVAAMNIPNAVPPARRALASNTFTVLVWDVTACTARETAFIAIEAREAGACAAALL